MNVGAHAPYDCNRRTALQSIFAGASPQRMRDVPDRSRLRRLDADAPLHVFAGYDHQASDAGDDRVTSQNWIIGLAGHPLGGMLTP